MVKKINSFLAGSANPGFELEADICKEKNYNHEASKIDQTSSQAMKILNAEINRMRESHAGELDLLREGAKKSKEDILESLTMIEELLREIKVTSELNTNDTLKQELLAFFEGKAKNYAGSNE